MSLASEVIAATEGPPIVLTTQFRPGASIVVCVDDLRGCLAVLVHDRDVQSWRQAGLEVFRDRLSEQLRYRNLLEFILMKD